MGAPGGDLTLAALGVPADALRTRLAIGAADKRRKAVRRAARVRGELKTLSETLQVEPKDADTPVVAKGELKLKAARSGSGWLLAARALVGAVAPNLPDRERRYPVVLGARRALEQTVVVKLPAGHAVKKLPEPVALESPFGRYALTWAAKGGELRLTRKWETRERVVPPDRYGALRVFLGAAHRAEARKVVIVQEGPT